MAHGPGFRGVSTGSRRRGAVALLGVIAIHVALYGWLRASGGWRWQPVARPEPAAVTLRLFPWRDPALSSPAPQPPVAVATPTRSASARDAAPTRPRADPAAITAPAAASPTITAAENIAVPGPPASAASQAPPQRHPQPLNLALPPGYALRPNLRNPAVEDVRANTARTTPEQRMAGAFDTRVIEENLGDGRRRIRQGDDCVIVHPSRIGQLMPFNDAAARTPSLVGACP